MGCDIHVFTEVKIGGTWYTYGHPLVRRCYSLFELLAGVRAGGDFPEPISPPKGLPPDISLVARLEAEHDGSDGHSHSYLTAAEIARFTPQWREFVDKQALDHWEYDPDRMFGYLFGNTWSGFTKYPDERPEGIEDVRWVFWFDN